MKWISYTGFWIIVICIGIPETFIKILFSSFEVGCKEIIKFIDRVITEWNFLKRSKI